MAGANMAGIFNVFGEEVKSRIKSCEFHFKEHRNKMAKKLASESSEVFRSLCNRLLESQSRGKNSNGPVYKQCGRKVISKILVGVVA